MCLRHYSDSKDVIHLMRAFIETGNSSKVAKFQSVKKKFRDLGPQNREKHK